MWFRLASANWTSTGNLGTMDSISGSWIVTCNTTGGIVKTTGNGMIEKGGTWTGTFTLSEGAEFTSATLTPASAGTVTHTVSSSTVTVTIANVSANCTLVVVATGGSSSGGGGGNEGGGGDEPIPDGTSINVLNLNDPDLTWDVTTEAGNTTGEFVSDSTKGVSGYIAVSAGDIIRGGTYRNTTNTDGTNYYPYKSSPVYWYDANKTFLGATPSNPCFKESSTGSNDFILTVPTSPSGIAYFRVMINKSYSTNIVTINNPRPENYIAYPNPTVLEGTISAPSSTINVFNPTDAITSTTMDTSGTAEDFKAQSDRGVSGFISCSGGDTIRGATYRSGQTSADTNGECYPFKSSPVYFYDSALNYISRTNTFTGSGYDYKMTVPMGASYFRVMINTTYINTEMVTINNNLPETFIAYNAM